MRLVFETGRNFSTFLAARLIFVTVLLGLAILFRPSGQSVFPYLILFTANVLLSVVCWEWFRRRTLAGPLRWVALTGAVVLDTLVLRYTGGADSEFVFLYFFSVGSAGLLTGLGGSLWAAVLATGGILWLYRNESLRYLAEHGFHVLFYAINFLLTAFLASYVFIRVRERERSHQRTLGELEQTRYDTQAILDSLGTGVLVIDLDMNVLYSNPAGRTILDLGEGENVEDLQRLLSSEPRLAEAIKVHVDNRDEEERGEIELATSKSMRPIGFSSSPFHDVEGELRGHIVLFSDLTRVKEAERLDRERDRLASIGKLSRDLAHGIRNPLATVRGCVEMIMRDKDVGGETKPYLELALRESDRLNMLLRDFQKFANLDTPRREHGDLSSVIRRHAAAGWMKLAIQDELPQAMEADFDADQIGLAIDAILLSLSEWAEGESEIRVSGLSNSRQNVRFLLTNKVISPEVRDAVFRPFSGVQRLSNGLALPTARKAVHAHGGELTLNAEPGVGTWFDLAI